MPVAGPEQERPRTNLRSALTSFVGRDEDVAQVGKLIDEYRLTTLIGPGGAGKTRLAIEAARPLVEQIPDGVWVVELATVNDAADVSQAVMTALGLRETLMGRSAESEPAERLVASLRSRNMVLVLDNCEHVIDTAAALAERLLSECPQLRVLATSREPLGITGEAVRPVRPLSLPPEDADPAEAMSHAAVRLLVDRARAARPEFAVVDRTVRAVVRVCRALDGMPLAIELAAARLRTMTAEQLAERIGDRFRILTGGSRTAMPRHQTLRAVIDWSWELLTAQEQILLRRLAAFSGGATVDAAERVCADDALPAAAVLDLISQLADKSLLVTDDYDAVPRFRMLETIKAYGLERLDVAGERDRFRRAHVEHFIELAEEADPQLRRADQLRWLPRLDADRDNILAALRGAIAAGEAGSAVRLVAATGWYWWIRGYRTEATGLVTAALALPGPVDEDARAAAYAIAALYATSGMGDVDQAADVVAYLREVGDSLTQRHQMVRLTQAILDPDDEIPLVDSADVDPWVRGLIQLNRAETGMFAGQPHADAEAAIRTSVAIFREVGERWGISFSLTTLADLLARRGDFAASLELYEEAIAKLAELDAVEDVPYLRLKQASLRMLRGDEEGGLAALAEAERTTERSGAPDTLAMTAYGKAEVARGRGDLSTARAQLDRFWEISQRVTTSPVIQAIGINLRAYLDGSAGDDDAARRHHAAALALAMSAGNATIVGQVLVGVADCALRQGDPHEAARLLSASVAVRGMPDKTLWDADRVEQAARSLLSDEEFAAATREGAHATMSTVHELAGPTLNL